MTEETGIGGAGRVFPPTRWTLIVGARRDPGARRAALEELLSQYWKPLYFYVRRKGRPVEHAKDDVQGFLAHLLESDFLDRADREKGRFRTYLRACFDHWHINEHEKAQAQKRGGGARVLSLDWEGAEREVPAAAEDPAAAYDREWTWGIVERALTRLRAEFDEGRRKAPAEIMLRYFRLDAAPSYAESAAECGMTVPQFKASLHRVRERFRTLVREEVSDTVADGRDTDGEIDTLLRTLRP